MLTSGNMVREPTSEPICDAAPHQTRALWPRSRRITPTITFTYAIVPVNSSHEITWGGRQDGGTEQLIWLNLWDVVTAKVAALSPWGAELLNAFSSSKRLTLLWSETVTYNDHLSDHRALKQRTGAQSCHGHVVAAEARSQRRQSAEEDQGPGNRERCSQPCRKPAEQPRWLCGAVSTDFSNVTSDLFGKNMATVQASGWATDDRAAER